jgi:type 1 glutamine amidotransferase
MNKWLKRALGLLLGITVLGVVGIFLAMKSMGIIMPNNDLDTVAPVLPVFERPAVLVFSKTNGFVHEDALPAADQMFSELAEQQGWDVYLTKNGAVHSIELLQQFDLVIWNNVSGSVLNVEQQTALKNWIEQGGGWMGVHGSGGDVKYHWPWYVNTLLGTQFVGHTSQPQFQYADVLVADAGGELVSHLSSPWRIANEEWYAFETNPRDLGYEIVLTIDESSYNTEGDNWLWHDRTEGEHPLVWRHSIGEGRAFYSAIGHQAVTYSIPEYRELWVKAMQWAR